jgi:hypothetical protein
VLGRKFPAAAGSSGSVGETIATGLVRPGIAILDRRAARLRAIEPTPASEDLRVYLGLYDPIVELSRQLLQPSEANDGGRSKELELIIAALGHEQRDVARTIGFKACATTFTEALGSV